MSGDEFGLASIDISTTTLEEVFLKAASCDHGSDEQKTVTEKPYKAASQEEPDQDATFVLPNMEVGRWI